MAVDDWPALMDEAGRHALAPLLHWCIEKGCPDVPPPAISRTLRAGFLANAQRNLLFSSELLRLTAAFDRTSLPVVPFKGPVLAWTLYDSPALREMSDLDLLVAPADLARARDVLLYEGYTDAYPGTEIRFWCNEMPLIRHDSQVVVDLHWELAPPYFRFMLDVSGFRARLRSVPIAGQPVAAFSTDDLLIFLCVHGAKHGWSSLSWLCDLARLIDRCAIDWDAVFSYASSHRASTILFLGVMLASDLLGCELPPEVRHRCRSSETAISLAIAIRSQFCEHQHLRARVIQFRLLDRTRDKVRLALGFLKPDPFDLAGLRLPAILFPIYYLTRPFRLVAKYARLVLSANR